MVPKLDHYHKKETADPLAQISDFHYLRTAYGKVMSEAGMMEYLRQNLFRFMAHQDGSTITKIISSKQISFEKQNLDQFTS